MSIKVKSKKAELKIYLTQFQYYLLRNGIFPFFDPDFLLHSRRPVF